MLRYTCDAEIRSGVCAMGGWGGGGVGAEARLKGELSFSRKRFFVSRPVCLDCVSMRGGKTPKEGGLLLNVHVALCSMHTHFPLIIFEAIC